MNELNAQKRLENAEAHLNGAYFQEALAGYQTLINETGYAGIAWFRMAEIFNELGEFENSLKAHHQSFAVEPALASKILPKGFKHHSYVYRNKSQIEVSKCPLCSGKLENYSCYNLILTQNFNENFDPIRVWKQCVECSHLCASAYPLNLNELLRESAGLQTPALEKLPLFGKIINSLKALGPYLSLLDIGCGAGEMSSVARELELNVTALDLNSRCVKEVENKLGIPGICADLLNVEIEQKFDIVLLGGVLEYLSNPLKAIEKASSLARSGGVLWISTPNYQSAQSQLMGVKNPMWRVCEQLQCFSLNSLEPAFLRFELELLDYNLSTLNPGSMELTLRRL